MYLKNQKFHGFPLRRNTQITSTHWFLFMNNNIMSTAEGNFPVCPEAYKPHPTQLSGCVASSAQYRHTAGDELTVQAGIPATAISSFAPAAEFYMTPAFNKSNRGIDYSTSYNQIETGIYSPYS